MMDLQKDKYIIIELIRSKITGRFFSSPEYTIIGI